MIIDPVPGSGVANPEIVVNRGFDALGALAIYGARGSTTSGLTWGYYGGRYDGAVIANGTLTLTDAADNYIVMHRTTGAVSFATNTTNWLATGTYGRLYKATTAGGAITALEDHRYGASGIFGGAAAPPKHPLGMYFSGKPANAAVLARILFKEARSLPSSWAGSGATAIVPAAATADLLVQKNGATIGTIRFAAGTLPATFVGPTATAFAIDDTLEIVAPSPQDANLSGVSITLLLD